MDGPSRFYDVETGGHIQLQLQPDENLLFRILRRFGYRDPSWDEPFEVPADLASFRTDLTSIPWFFAWLVPGMGSHLPAVLLHDGLVVREGEEKTHRGPDIDREEADRILRDAMASLGTPVLRRWLIWTAVIVATCFATLRPRWYWRTIVVATLATVATLGVIATLDLVDAWDVLPWMGDHSVWRELVLGGAFAILVPLAISVLWRRLWRAGLIVGIALAFLLHVTVVLFAIYGVYRVLEAICSAREGTGGSVKRNLEKIAAGETRPPAADRP